MTAHDLPAVNATLNAVSGVLLIVGFFLIRAQRIDQHRRYMMAAFAASALFLVSYIVYHAQVGSVRFTRQGLVRPLYFSRGHRGKGINLRVLGVLGGRLAEAPHEMYSDILGATPSAF